MAKFVLAGRADCPYYAKAELLADYLQTNLPHFRIHKIPQHPDNWEKWLQETCEKNGWNHKTSPIIWRELLDRGGKGVLLGGYNAFLEHAKHYYNITSDMMTEEMLLIAKENLQTQIEVEAEEEELKSLINPLHIWVNRATSHICYFLIPFLLNGEIFGMDTEITLHLLDRRGCKELLKSVVMETQDLAFPLLRSVVMHTDLDNIFLEADVIILLDDILQESIPTLEECIRQVAEQCELYGPLIEKNAKSCVKVIIMGKTFANLKTLMIMTHAPTINPRNIVTVATLLENEAKALLARKLQKYATGIKNLVVWGNISGSTFIDLTKAKLYRYESAIWGPPSFFRPLMDMLFDREWMRTEFVAKLGTLSSWGQHCSGMMPVHAIITLLRYWYHDSPPGEIVSLGIFSEGQFGIPEGVVYCMPAKFQNGTWEVLTEFEVSEKNLDYLKILAFELIREKQVALGEIEEIYPRRREVRMTYAVEEEEITPTSKESLKPSTNIQESTVEKEGQPTAEAEDLPTELSPSKSEEEGNTEPTKGNVEDGLNQFIILDVFEGLHSSDQDQSNGVGFFSACRFQWTMGIHGDLPAPTFLKMDLEQQEALNAVQNSVYRKALKLRAVQSLCQLDLTNVCLIQDILLNYQCQAGKQSSLPIQQLLHLLKVLFKRVRLDKPGQVEPKAPELTLNLLSAAYDRNGGGFIQPRSAAAALIALSGDSLLTKYRAFFQLYTACAGRSSSRGIHITRNSVRTLLTDLLQILVVVGERCNPSHVEAAVHGCFSGVLGSAVGEERFLTWLQSEPAILLWLPTCHRLSVTKMVTHQVMCNVCNSFPITGLRYRCLKCLNFDLCQVCFFTGQYRKPHKKSHPMMEHCVPVSAKENTKLFFRTIRNNLRQGRCRRKEAQRRKALVMSGEDFFTCTQAPSCSVPPTSTEQPVPPDPHPSMRTLDLQRLSPRHYEESCARQVENNNRSLSQEKPVDQVATSFKADMVKTQELIRALHSERRYLRKQLNKWKDKVQLLCFTQEVRNCKLEAKIQDLIVGQESLKVALQEMKQELKKITAYSKDPLKERNVWNGSGCPPLKASTTRYTKYKPSGFPEITQKSEFFKDANPEVVHCDTTGVKHVPPGKHSGNERPETSRDYHSQIIISSPSCTRETLVGEKETEEEKELQLLMLKLKDALSLQIQSGQPSILKKKVLSAAEHVTKSFSALTSQLVLPTRKS